MSQVGDNSFNFSRKNSESQLQNVPSKMFSSRRFFLLTDLFLFGSLGFIDKF